MSGLRRKDKEITDRAVIEEVLVGQEVGRLATSVDGEPYVVPVNYVYTKGRIIFHSHREGRKMESIRRNPRVCFEVDTAEKTEGATLCDYSYRYFSAVARGEAREITGDAERLEALRRIVAKYAPGKERSLAAADLARYAALVLVEIRVTELTGRRSPVSG